MSAVFVSHAHADNERCDAFVEALRARGVDVWYDRSNLQAGHSLSGDIQQELESRLVFVLLATPASLESYWVQAELDAFRDLSAHDRTRVIVPVRLAACEIPLLLRGYKWIEAVDVPFETALDQLAPALGFPTRAELAAAERARQAAAAAEQRRRADEERKAERQQVALELARARAQVQARLTADLALTALLTLALLTLASLFLSFVFPVVPRTVAVGAGVLDALLVVTAGVVRPVRRAVVREGRAARKGLATVLSALLTLAVVVTTLFLTKPPTVLVVTSRHPGYDFSYTYHAPTHLGGTVTIGAWFPITSLNPPFGAAGLQEPLGTSDACVAQLPDLSLELNGWRADQCTQVPTVANGGEDLLGKWTVFHIDPHAVWSDGTPITADDFRFAYRLLADPQFGGGDPWDLMAVTAPDSLTVRIQYSKPYADYLSPLQLVFPLPFHVYATGKFAGVFHPKTGAYNAALAQQLVASASFTTKVAVDNGPFVEDIAHSFGPPDGRLVLSKNPRFFSNFFHPPALDQVNIVSVFNAMVGIDANEQATIPLYRSGQLTLAFGMGPTSLSKLGGIPKSEIVTSPQTVFEVNTFDRTSAAPNAHANGGTSIFADLDVRKAFLEAYDRCAAAKAILHLSSCTDPNLFSTELTIPSGPYYDPAVILPSYNPTDAAQILDQKGFPVVDGERRFKDGKTPLHLVIDTDYPGDASYIIAQRMVQDFATNLQVSVSLLPGGVFNDPLPPSDIVAATGFSGIDPIGITGMPAFQGADPQAVALDQEGAETLDQQQRGQVYRRLLGYLAQQLYIVPVFTDAEVALVKPTLCNFKEWPETAWDTWNMADWYVAPSCP
jgi:ABC-type transport system substrate-binding protein